jgi:hypothetical protein
MGLFDHLTESLVVDLSRIRGISTLFRSLIDEQSAGAPGAPVLRGAIMTQLLVHMLRELAARSDADLAWLRALKDPRLGQAIDRIMADPFAQHTGMSPAEFRSRPA